MLTLRIARLGLAVCAAAAIAAGAQAAPALTSQGTPAAAMNPAVPTPKSVLGHEPGDDFYLANYTESLAYFRKLAASSHRIRLVDAGKTSNGQDFYLALISSAQNLAQLDRYRDINRRLTWARGLNHAQAHALAQQGKVFVHIDGGMHSTEVAGAQQSILLAYKLVASEHDPQVDAILHNVILVLWPTLNPDGQNEVVAWYRRNLGTRFEVSPTPFLYQKYVGHDNNRDGYMNNMVESQDVTRQELIWNPEIFYTHHQTAPFPARIFIPPFVEPISSNIQPLMMRWLNAIGANMAAYLDEHDMPGAISRVGFDNWYPGYQDFTGVFRNSIAFFTETALYGYATPHFYTVRNFPRNYQSLTSGIFYSSPWKGGWWRLSDAVRYMEGASMSVLDTAAKYREQLLYNKYQAGRNNIERFTHNPPYAYVLSATQTHRAEAADLARILRVNGIEVSRAVRPFAANDRSYAAGSFVIAMNQPFAGLVKELFGRQDYPSILQSGRPVRPYDVAGWTLPLQMGVEADAVMQPLTAAQRGDLQLMTHWVEPPGSIQGEGGVFLFPPESNARFAALNQLLGEGARVGFVEKPADGLEAGTAVVTGVGRAAVAAIVAKTPIEVRTAASAPAEVRWAKAPRVGVYRPWMPSIDGGWTRWVLTTYGFKPISLRNGDIRASNLKDRLDAIILPDARPQGLMNGFGPGVVPGEYTGGIGLAGVDALRQFVQAGGTLITFNNASLFAIQQFGLPVRNVVAKLKPNQFYCSGSLLRAEIPAAKAGVAPADDWGMGPDLAVMFETGPVFAPEKDFHGTVLATYPAGVNPLESGYLMGPEKIEGQDAALEVDYGAGHIVLLGFKPEWRAQSHGTYKFFFNAIYAAAAQGQ